MLERGRKEAIVSSISMGRWERNMIVLKVAQQFPWYMYFMNKGNFVLSDISTLFFLVLLAQLGKVKGNKVKGKLILHSQPKIA